MLFFRIRTKNVSVSSMNNRAMNETNILHVVNIEIVLNCFPEIDYLLFTNFKFTLTVAFFVDIKGLMIDCFFVLSK